MIPTISGASHERVSCGFPRRLVPLNPARSEGATTTKPDHAGSLRRSEEPGRHQTSRRGKPRLSSTSPEAARPARTILCQPPNHPPLINKPAPPEVTTPTPQPQPSRRRRSSHSDDDEEDLSMRESWKKRRPK